MSFNKIIYSMIALATVAVTSTASASCVESARWLAQREVGGRAGQTQVVTKVAGEKYIVTTNVGTRLKKTFLVRFHGSCDPRDASISRVEPFGFEN